MKRHDTIYMNSLEAQALHYAGSGWSEEEILRDNNITHLLEDELKRMVKDKELITIAIIGKTVKGKSTLMGEWVRRINNWLKIETGLQHIASDQLEFSRKTKAAGNEEWLKNCAVGIDEYNRMSETDYGSSTERAYFDYIGQVQAQRFIHRISCAPDIIYDEQADIIFNVLNKDVQKKETWFEVYYRFIKPSGKITQLIGYAKTNVEATLESDYWKDYVQRKFLRMELMSAKGIKDIRDMEWAETTLELYNRLKGQAGLMRINKDVVRSHYNIVIKEKVQFSSILLTEKLTADVTGLLGQEAAIYSTKRQLETAISMQEKNDNITNNNRVEVLRAALVSLLTNRDIIVENLKYMVNVNKEYLKIGEKR